MTILVALILGIVEGLTEYLPVSSTGHLILAGHFLGGEGEAAQVVRDRDPARRDPGGAGALPRPACRSARASCRRASRRRRASLLALIAGFVPTAAVGLLVRKAIKAHLFGARPVADALIVGGVVMIVVELVRGREAARRREPGSRTSRRCAAFSSASGSARR